MIISFSSQDDVSIVENLRVEVSWSNLESNENLSILSKPNCSTFSSLAFSNVFLEAWQRMEAPSASVYLFLI